jgi:hypothetical protein
MNGFLLFLGFVNSQLHTKQIERLEAMLMPANFSSIVSEFMSSTIPKQCSTIVKNRYHNGHPDLIPATMFPNDTVQHAPHGIEIKASRYLRAWQGHNPEDVWLMVFVFDSNRPKAVVPRPFHFVKVIGAELSKNDWVFSGRSETSRRTITASITESGYQKMAAKGNSPNTTISIRTLFYLIEIIFLNTIGGIRDNSMKATLRNPTHPLKAICMNDR